MLMDPEMPEAGFLACAVCNGTEMLAYDRKRLDKDPWNALPALEEIPVDKHCISRHDYSARTRAVIVSNPPPQFLKGEILN